jgi:hypothetical protein
MKRLLLLVLLSLAACSNDASDRIVGTWEPVAGTEGAQMRFTFFADGRALIVARPALGSPQTFDARFSVAADTLLTLCDSQGTERFRLDVSRDTLRLTSPISGVRAAYVRVQTE